MTAFDIDRPWALARDVALRPERFGALAYSFETRRLSFLKSRALLDVVRALGEHPSGRAACAAVGIGDAELPQVAAALSTLAQSRMITERVSA